jgi:hypothetical protein
MSKKNQIMDDEDQDDMEIIELDAEDDDDNDLRSDDGDDDRLESDQRGSQDDGSDGSEANSRQLRRKRQKERQKASMKQTKEENMALLQKLAEAEQRLAALETRNIQSDAQTADQRYNYALNQVQLAEQQLKEAFETGDGDKAINAQRLREQSVRLAHEADAVKKRLSDPQLQSKKSVLDPITENYAQQWMRKNSWFDPNGSDEDSAIARAIDEAWSREAQGKGISPASEQYWDELDERVARRLGTDDAPRKHRKSSPPVSGRGDSSRPSTGDNKVYLSAERVKALKDAGVWDDPALRKRYVRRFQEYDRQNSN